MGTPEEVRQIKQDIVVRESWKKDYLMMPLLQLWNPVTHASPSLGITRQLDLMAIERTLKRLEARDISDVQLEINFSNNMV